MLKDERIRIIVGHYGSGKTEFAVNYAVQLAQQGRKVALADLDVVNVYFRSREKAALLTDMGIHVISGALGHAANLDLPAISSAVIGPLQNESYDVVLDVGGDSVGARVLARYKTLLLAKGFDMFCVVNANRAATGDAEGAIHHLRAIEEQTGLGITGLINNTHMLRETSVQDVLRGQEVASEVSTALGVPIRYVSALEGVAASLPDDLAGRVLPLRMYMREDWM